MSSGQKDPSSASCVPLDRLLSLFEPLFFHLENEVDENTHILMLGGGFL